MSKFAFPAVNIPREDYTRLEQLATVARLEHHPVAEFLLSELRRAHVTNDQASLDDVVTLNKWVTYRVNWGPPENRALVHPQDCVSPERQLSVMSPEGAALLGLSVGDRMPFIGIDGLLHLLTVMRVDANPKIIIFGRRSEPDVSYTDNDPFNPGPSAA